jgi:DNA-binding LacI/PurR family transcriptional regulator
MTDFANRRWVTSREVAELASVSRSAVSRCFTPGASIAPETRRRILAAAEALGYRPNAFARGLNTRRSGLIGVVVSDVGNPFYARLVEALAIEIQGRGHAPLVFVAKDAAATDAMLPELLTFQVDGVLVASATLSLQVTRLYNSAQTPIVLLDRMADHDEDVAGDVSADNVAAAAMVADLIAAAGCRRPAYMAGLENTSTSRDRGAGFARGLSQHGLSIAARGMGGYSYEGGLKAARTLLAAKHPPDAIFCANDEMALAVLDVARGEFGLTIPGDLAVVGFDNSAPGALAAYNLTTVDQGLESMAKSAVSMIEQIISGEQSQGRLLLPCTLIRRGTT